ncbi:MAG: NRAMP family divalent metal transporter [Candidatus Dormibacter sp.]|uniref:NRAMP family divalent metal transporter n=1 Tax=Candidatus Dormibacter sp. TaxID=2973982 RepID=UPI000DB50AAA|nr:MAG: manganese transporter [Candidatus Dormibacteraeota bacterium]
MSNQRGSSVEPRGGIDPISTSRAVLDPAHVGDITGALGTIRLGSGPPRSLRQRLLVLLAVIGPGIIVMVGDNDAGGVATYAQAGQNYGTSLLWELLLLIPVLIVNQEMVVRLGAVTGMGHGKMIFERFGRWWGIFAVGDLFLLNFLTLVTEFIGVSLALEHFGLSPYISVPLAGLALIVVTASGSFRRWERVLFVFVAANFLVIPLVVISHPQIGPVLHDFVVPGIQGGLTGDSVLLVIAIVGTTVAPWQLFFQQSNIVDKRITPRWISYERADTVLGSVITVIGAAALVVTCAAAFGGSGDFGHFTDAGQTGHSLSRVLGKPAGAMFAIVLLNASLIGASAVALATSYAAGDTFGVRHSLHWNFREARGFYASFAALVVGAAAIVLIPHAPLGLITTAVQALAGLLLPSASVFLLLLCNDRAVLGPWVNPAWLNAIAAVIITVLLTLSGILTVTTLFPGVDVKSLAEVMAALVLAALLSLGAFLAVRGRGPRTDRTAARRQRQQGWTMPPLALLDRPTWSPMRRFGMSALRAYLVIAALLLVVKSIQLAAGAHS